MSSCCISVATPVYGSNYIIIIITEWIIMTVIISFSNLLTTSILSSWRQLVRPLSNKKFLKNSLPEEIVWPSQKNHRPRAVDLLKNSTCEFRAEITSWRRKLTWLDLLKWDQGTKLLSCKKPWPSPTPQNSFRVNDVCKLDDLTDWTVTSRPASKIFIHLLTRYKHYNYFSRRPPANL